MKASDGSFPRKNRKKRTTTRPTATTTTTFCLFYVYHSSFQGHVWHLSIVGCPICFAIAPGAAIFHLALSGNTQPA
jgi:hypothetical protein